LCDNDFPFGYEADGGHEAGDGKRSTFAATDAPRWKQSMTQQPRHMLAWVVLLAVFAYVSYLAFRNYLSPDFLIGYANLFAC
jgi:hypothetical protein